MIPIRCLLFLTGLLFFVQPAAAKRAESVSPLSPQATVTLLTLAPGDAVYSVFGHTALWVQDPATGLSEVFNYGTFDFRTDFFILKFARGKLPYMLSVGNIDHQLYGAQYENRTLTAQLLNLSASQKNRLYAFLLDNYQSEKRYYKYDFFYDNCTTRVRDALQAACGDSLQYGNRVARRTFRQWIDRYLQTSPWLDFGIDLGVASPADVPATARQSMFLPDNLLDLTAQGTVLRNGKTEPLEASRRILYQAAPPAPATNFTPGLLFWLLLGVGAGLTAWQWRGTGRQFWLDATLFTLVGVLGWVLLLLWVATDHLATVRNWHLLWAWPWHLPAALWLLKKHKPGWLRLYFVVYMAVLTFLLLAWAWLPQRIDFELLPLVLLLLLRSGFLVYRLRLSVQQAK